MRSHGNADTVESNFLSKAHAVSCHYDTIKPLYTDAVLAIHERTHTYEKPLLCPYPGCGARFSDSSNLAKHRKTHGEEGVHVCKFPGCSKSFHRLDQLKKHRAAHQNSGEASLQPSEPIKLEAEGSHEGSNMV